MEKVKMKEIKAELSNANKKEVLVVIKNAIDKLEKIEGRTFSGDLRDILASLKAKFSQLLHG